MHFASTILMVRPAAFGFNEQTAPDNAFQQHISLADVQRKALQEFDEMVITLRSAGIEVIVIDDTPEPPRPDAIFPNNWFCTLNDGCLALFPMFAVNRRTERRKDIVDKLMHEFKISELEDWTAHEDHHSYLEGTGSMVHTNKIVYACLSERTNALLLHQFAERIGYEAVSFNAKDKNGLPVYHTNVMMCIGNGFCIACEGIIDSADIDAFITSLTRAKTKLISIHFDQVLRFAGNMLQLQNQSGEYILVMSRSAFDSLDNDQRKTLEQHTRLLPVDITTIETIGGGSARCMMAEIFLPSLTK
jgi:hypothetical protein